MLGLGSGISPILTDMHDQKSIKLNGTNQYIDIDVVAGRINPNQFSISAWFKFTGAVTSGRHIFRTQVDSNNLIQLFYHASNNDMRFVQKRGGTACQADSNGSIVSVETDDAWHHAAGTIDVAGGEIKFYLDGTLKETTALEGDFAEEDCIIADIGQTTQGSSYWYGNLNDVAIFNSVLTAANITAIYNGGKPNDINSILSPLAYYRFEAPENIVGALDSSGGGYHGTMVNSPTRHHDTP